MYLIKKITSRNGVQDLGVCFKAENYAKAYLKGMDIGLTKQGWNVKIITPKAFMAYTDEDKVLAFLVEKG
jgi:hypothetical protein